MKFTVTRNSPNVVWVEVEDEWAPVGTGKDFESAKADFIEELEALLAEARTLEEPTP